MIEIGSLIPRSTALPARRQPVEEGVVSSEAVCREATASKPPLRVVSETADAEHLRIYNRRNQCAELQEQGVIGLQSRRALAAYDAMGLVAERDYLRAVMGIDEYA